MLLALGNEVTLTCHNADFATVAKMMYEQAGVVLVLDVGARASGDVTLSVDKQHVGDVCNRIASQLQLAWQPLPGRLLFTAPNAMTTAAGQPHHGPSGTGVPAMGVR